MEESDFGAARRVLLRWGGRDLNPESNGSVWALGGRGDEVVVLGGGQGRLGGWAGSGGWDALVVRVHVARQRVRARVRGIVRRGV